ncbi:hypothetical protein F3Y22_tig00110347pilonHSYRG00084 [Hibiscus syriacus]|uniref:Uncharacterized protein n=1 Tax=Hibiscus syriacus TaxID=106335 RepID=A0A6A3AUC2_HIBSY|nr:hypothetical protein F3Y22_tig00110347pilonHSYRG00084 [Hibiscus syriacus]
MIASGIVHLLSRVMWFTVYVLGGVVARDLFPRVLCMRSVLVENWEVSGWLTRTGSMRILLTSTLRLSWLMLHTMLSAMTQELTGSAIQFTNTESFEGSHLLVRKTGVCTGRATYTTRTDLHTEQPGRETTHFPFVATAEFVLLGFLLLPLFVLEAIILSLKVLKF